MSLVGQPKGAKTPVQVTQVKNKQMSAIITGGNQTSRHEWWQLMLSAGFCEEKMRHKIIKTFWVHEAAGLFLKVSSTVWISSFYFCRANIFTFSDVRIRSSQRISIISIYQWIGNANDANRRQWFPLWPPHRRTCWCLTTGSGLNVDQTLVLNVFYAYFSEPSSL